MTKISIIIPVYNMESYIENAIKSIQRQTLNELEIICIDDGSTDNTLKILEKYGQTDPRVRIMTQCNQGAGVARNKGLACARGEFVAFLDADDYYFDNEALRDMYDLCEEKGVDLCGSYSRKIQADGSIKNICLCGIELPANNVYNYSDYQFDYGYVLFLYRKKLLEDHKIVFPPYRRYQDPPFMVKAMYAAGRFTFVDKYLYCCRVSNNVKKFNSAKTADLLRALMDNMQFAKEHHLDILWEKTVGRLEYEYGDLIAHSMEKNDSTILQLLVRANEMISRVRQGDSYVIRPLRLMAKAASEWDYRAYLERLLEQTEHLAIYGAGMMGQAFLKYLAANHFQEKVRCFLVTSQAGNAEAVQGIPVISLDRYIGNEVKNTDLVVVAVDGGHQREIEAILTERGIEDAELLDTVFLSELSW